MRVSIDAVGKRNEYIRYPSNWEIILRNLRLLTDIKKEINMLGGVGNVARNLGTIGVKTYLIGLIGNDEIGNTIEKNT